MSFSKFTTIFLLGVVTFNSSILAQGTKAGTEVYVEPTIEYTMGGRYIKERVVRAKYIVDKIVKFKVTRVLGVKQVTVKGLTLLAPFKVSNYGNSIENFVLDISYGDIRNFDFDKTVIYIDKNKNGKLEASEEVDNSIVRNLSVGSSQLIWLGAVASKNAEVNRKVYFGLQAKASSGGRESIYLKATKFNNILKQDTVFGDDNSENDGFFNNSYINRYLWTIKQSIDLGIKLEINIMSSDPLNGVAKTKKEAYSGKFFSIPGATHVRSWKIYNNSLVTVKDIHFTIDADGDVEKFATNSKNTWWKGDSRTHVLLSSSNKIIGKGLFNSGKNSIDFTIKELKGGDEVYPHVVTVLR